MLPRASKTGSAPSIPTPQPYPSTSSHTSAPFLSTPASERSNPPKTPEPVSIVTSKPEGVSINLSLLGRMSQDSVSLGYGSSDEDKAPHTNESVATPGLPSNEIMSVQQGFGFGVTPAQPPSLLDTPKGKDASSNILVMDGSDEEGSSDTAIVPSACVGYVDEVVPVRDATPEVEPVKVEAKEEVVKARSKSKSKSKSKSPAKKRRRFRFNVETDSPTPKKATPKRLVTPSTRSSVVTSTTATTVTPSQKRRLKRKRRKMAESKFLDFAVEVRGGKDGDASTETESGTESTCDMSFVVSEGSESQSIDAVYRRRLLDCSQLPSDGEGNCDVPLLTNRSPKKIKIRKKRRIMDDCLRKYEFIDDEDETEIDMSDLGEEDEEEEEEEEEASEYQVQLDSEKVQKNICFKCRQPGHWMAQCPLNVNTRNPLKRSLPADCSFMQNAFNRPQPFVPPPQADQTNKPVPFVPVNRQV
eukprot:TRINITY_DN43_c0_g2_i1.p1 TRINITY_DN43_c0_g2~~TRINITY_DN43_c0_g2_i1.p1  ORF type:complete len:471 (+),score=115.39 TRINITY_DN43_c0_g2_i1:768-2180(+)